MMLMTSICSPALLHLPCRVLFCKRKPPGPLLVTPSVQRSSIIHLSDHAINNSCAVQCSAVSTVQWGLAASVLRHLMIAYMLLQEDLP